jgi:hypothetical protein
VNALFLAMVDIVAIEHRWPEETKTAFHRSKSAIREFYAASRLEYEDRPDVGYSITSNR